MTTRRRTSANTPVPAKAADTSALAAAPAPISAATHAKRLSLLTLILATPYVAWVLYCYVHLQSGLLREPVSVSTTRPLLIVGTQSSGTTDMTSALQDLGLEVAHETSDAAWSFCRDGTISWLHLLRFMPGIAPTKTTTEMCRISRRNSEFAPIKILSPRVILALLTRMLLVALALASLVSSGFPPCDVPRASQRMLIPARMGRVLAPRVRRAYSRRVGMRLACRAVRSSRRSSASRRRHRRSRSLRLQRLRDAVCAGAASSAAPDPYRRVVSRAHSSACCVSA